MRKFQNLIWLGVRVSGVTGLGFRVVGVRFGVMMWRV